MLDNVITILGAPVAVYGLYEVCTKLAALLQDRIQRHRSGASMVVLTTHIKYIIWEDYCELIKLRHIRTYRSVHRIRLDRYPRSGILGHENEPSLRNFYSLPGTASKKGDMFVIDLEEHDEFRAHKEYPLVFGYIIPEKLAVIHPNEDEDGMDISGPLGTDAVTLEVHLPRTRRFGPEGSVKVFVVFEDGREQNLTAKEYQLSIDRAFKNTELSRGTDVLRFRMRPPKDLKVLRIRWPWQFKEDEGSEIRFQQARA